MTTIASKNQYELLGNDPELDPDREPEPPTKVMDKPVPRTGKRNAGAEGPAGGSTAANRPLGGGRGGRDQGSARGDQAGSTNNRAERRDDGLRNDRHANRNREQGEGRPGRGRGQRARGDEARGGRGYSGRYQRTNRDDRGDHSNVGEHEKQAAHGWGENTGAGEWADEQAGDAIASAEAKNEAGLAPDTSSGDPAFSNGPGAAGEALGEDAAPAEPEEQTKSYDEYLAEQAQKRLALGDNSLQTRKANEGSKQKFPTGTEVKREATDFFVGAEDKARRERQQKDKNRLNLEGQYYAPADSGDRGGRGRGRGGRARGEGRGDFRGDRSDRGDRPGRGSGRARGGGEFRGNRGGPRGGSGSTAVNTADSSAFPALGS